MPRRNKSNFRSRGSGFTLIELVLAMAMVVMIAGSLYTYLNGAYHAVNTSETALAPIRNGFIAFESLQTDLENALPPTVATNASAATESWLAVASGTMTGTSGLSGASSITAGTTATVLCVQGNFEAVQSQGSNGQESDDMVFFTTTDSPIHSDGNGDAKQVEITVEPAANGDNVLVRRVTRNLLSENQVDPDEEILCHHVHSFTLQYFDGAAWNTTWDSTVEDNELPVAVEVVLVLENTDPKGKVTLQSFTRIFNLSCSTAAQDPNMPAASGGIL